MTKFFLKYSLVILALFLLFNAKAQEASSLFQTANTYYKNRQYDEAEKLYLLVLKKDSKNVNALYNLGNTYFHLKQFPYAVWYYERALKLNPDSKYIKHNIEETNNKLFNKIEFSKEFFVTKQLKGLVHATSSNGWGTYLLIALWLGSISMVIYFVTKHNLFYKIGITALLVAVLFGWFTYSTFAKEHQQDYAIILTTTAYLKNAPVETMNAADTIQTGVKVQIIDADKNWRKIKLPNDKTGWIEKSNLGLI